MLKPSQSYLGSKNIRLHGNLPKLGRQGKDIFAYIRKNSNKISKAFVQKVKQIFFKYFARKIKHKPNNSHADLQIVNSHSQFYR